jgi:carboxypeptidase C (cathepsin A)
MLKQWSKCILVLSLLSFPLRAEDDSESQESKKKEQEKLIQEAKEEFVETQHQIVINGQPLAYKATAGNLLLRDEKDNQPKASFFFISYTKQDVKNTQNRPITFCFNGGPGSSSVWLHLGTFGPRRVFLTDQGDAVPPYHLVDNEFSILDLTDLVFIDPISTGYSRAIPPSTAKNYHGVEEDIKSIAEFIRLYITRYNRWDSPKFIAGESYGTTRAVSLAGYMHDKQYLYVNGLILISSVLNFQSIQPHVGNDQPYLMFLPTYTATAWYHGKLSPDLQSNFSRTMQASQEFINTEYATALFKGDLLSRNERESIISKLSRFTGLAPSYIDRSDLRIDSMQYAKELLRNQKRTVGRFDSRFTGIDSSTIGECAEEDPSVDAIFGAFTATFNTYIHNELQWKGDQDYKILANIAGKWDYSGVATNQYLNVADTLRNILTRNTHLRVFVANGYYDLATPFFGTEYTFNHLGLDPSLVGHISMEYYDAGHMMYIHRPSLIKLKSDLARYYTNTLQEK